MDRHRLVWLFFQRRTNLFDKQPKRMLHVAPEPAIESSLRNLSHLDYVTADLLESGVMVRMDITNIQYPDESFDVIYCSHVLEHVPDDRKAMREFHRVLRESGWAVFMVPVTVAETIEDPTCSDPAERERRFGQHDHVRRYGADFVDRLRGAGFTVDVIRPADISSRDEHRRYTLPERESIYFCRKNA
jgi:SAM-dependent methyltransferase